MTRQPFAKRSLDALLRDLLGRSRAASRGQVSLSEARALQRLRQEPMWTFNAPLLDAVPAPARRVSPAVEWAATVAAVVLVIAAGLAIRDVAGRLSLAAVVEAGESSLYLSSKGQKQSLQALERIALGSTVQSNGGAGGMLRLADGSRVEMRARSELSLERAEDGVRIRLHHGGIIVNAAKQRDSHLYVQTKDFVVSVVGTVFMVNSEEAGSRVAVLEGEVRVQQGDIDQKLKPGEEVTTDPLTLAPALSEDIAWSRNAPTHLALLEQSALTPVRDPQAVASPAEPRSATSEIRRLAQTPDAAGSQPSRLLSVDVVMVDTAASDSSGQPVLDLSRSDFTVLEDGVQQAVESMTLVSEPAPYYLIGYRSTTPASAEGFRRVEVRVSRPGVRVAAVRRGYIKHLSLGLDPYGQDAFSRGAYSEDEPGLTTPVVRERRGASYTPEAMLARIQGNVVVEVVVGVDGRVSRSRITTSLDKARGLDDQALAAVSQWTFTPGELKGEKVPVRMQVVVTFRMR
jgi:TonB family protein